MPTRPDGLNEEQDYNPHETALNHCPKYVNYIALPKRRRSVQGFVKGCDLMASYGGADLTRLLVHLREGGAGLPEGGAEAGHGGPGGGHHGESTSVRAATYRGHEIRVETTYRATIDGGLDVLNNGAVHYHGLPQYAVASALDVLRLVIDHFGTEPPARDELGEFR